MTDDKIRQHKHELDTSCSICVENHCKKRIQDAIQKTRQGVEDENRKINTKAMETVINMTDRYNNLLDSVNEIANMYLKLQIEIHEKLTVFDYNYNETLDSIVIKRFDWNKLKRGLRR